MKAVPRVDQMVAKLVVQLADERVEMKVGEKVGLRVCPKADSLVVK